MNFNRHEAAAYLRIGTRQLHEITKAGKIGVCRIGSRPIYTKEQLDEYLSTVAIPARVKRLHAVNS